MELGWKKKKKKGGGVIEHIKQAGLGRRPGSRGQVPEGERVNGPSVTFKADQLDLIFTG